VTDDAIRSFRKRLDAALRRAVATLPTFIGDEHLYAFSLYTSGQSDFGYVCFSANTEEGLAHVAEGYAARYPDYAGEAGKRRLRWSTCDWEYHDFAPCLTGDDLPDRNDRPHAMDEAIYQELISSLRAFDREGGFGTGQARAKVTLNVVCGDMSEAFFRNGLAALNPKEVVERYIEECTPEPFIRIIKKRPLEKQIEAWLALYEGLMLGRESLLITQAQTADFEVCDAQAQLCEIDHPRVALGLVDIVERHAFSPAFNEKGTPEWERDGACTSTSKLSTGAVFAIADLGTVSDEIIDRLQAILARRSELDQSLPLTSTLAENIARCLHTLRPDVFPASQLHPKTNHLANAEAFLRKVRS
jgi:hypothetical protein